MDAVEASTPLYVPPSEVYRYIQSFEGAVEFSDHVDRIEQSGDGGPGTDYYIGLSWWRLSWTSHSRVTEVDPPNRIDWRTVGDVRARGRWLMDALDGADLPEGREVGTELALRVEFDPGSVRGAGVTRLVPVERLLRRVRPVVARECERLVAGAVVDLEGERRPIEYTVHRMPDSFPL
ncbi:MAG: SRPBCC family protein [Haloarculaceae archaeon]